MLRLKLKLECARVFNRKHIMIMMFIFFICFTFLSMEIAKNGKTQSAKSGNANPKNIFSSPMPGAVTFSHSGNLSNSLFSGGNAGSALGLLGSLFMVYMGMTAFKSKRLFFSFENIGLRLLFLDLYLIILGLLILLSSALLRLSFSHLSLTYICHISLYSLFYFNFFYSAGVLIKAVTLHKHVTHLTALIFWLFSVWYVPAFLAAASPAQNPISQTTHTRNNFTSVMPFSHHYNNYFICYPTTFYPQLYMDSAIVDPLPSGIYLAYGLTFFYTISMLLISRWFLRKKAPPIPDEKPISFKTDKGKTYFILCKDESYREKLFQTISSLPEHTGLDDEDNEKLDLGVKSEALLEYYCAFLQTGLQEARNILAHFNSESHEGQKSPDPLKPGSEESHFALYCSAIMAGKCHTIVINDVLKKKSPAFEGSFLRLMAYLNQKEITVIYLGTEIFEIALPHSRNIAVDSHKGFRIDPLAVKLR